jgi:anti-sigma regulatory factor (Ser/Thr protein kinase)
MYHPVTLQDPMPPSAAPPLRLRPEIGELSTLVDFIDEVAAQHDIPHADVHAITLAAEELFANTLNHSQPPATLIEFSLAVDKNCIFAVYTDDAPPFDPTAYPEVDTGLPLDQRPIGGLGIHFIRRSMSTFRYQRAGDCNVITFGRTLTPRKH